MYAFFKGTNIDISTFVPFNCQRWDYIINFKKCETFHIFFFYFVSHLIIISYLTMINIFGIFHP
jgi:hypothetical protein